MNKITILENNQIFGDNQLELFKKIGTKAAVTDYAILTGAYVSNSYTLDDDNSLSGRCGCWWTKTFDGSYDWAARVVIDDGSSTYNDVIRRDYGVRPALPYSSISEISPSGARSTSKEGTKYLEFGYYPQDVALDNMQTILNENYERGLLKIREVPYTSDTKKYNAYGEDISLRKNEVCEFNGKLYTRVVSNSYNNEVKLSNGIIYKRGDTVWVEVSPVRWYNNEETKTLVSEKILFGGIPFDHSNKYDGNFENTDMYKYLNEHFAKELMHYSSIKEEDNQINISIISHSNLDSDIQKILNKIEEICRNLPNESKDKINNIINPLINNYMESKKESIPRFGKKKDMLEVPGTSILSKKTKLLADLEKIKTTLLANENINFLYEINNYRNILNGKNNNIDINDIACVKIKEIVDMLNTFDENKKEEYIKIINEYIDTTIESINKELTMNNDNKLVIEYKNYKRDFLDNIHNLHKRIKLISDNYYQFKQIRDSLSINTVLELSQDDNDSIVSDINKVNYIISKIIND